MIIVKIQGGLGNQLFQYAAGRRLAIKNRTELKLDTTLYRPEHRYYRHYHLNFFNIKAAIANDREIADFLHNKLLKLADFFKPLTKRSIINYQGYDYDRMILKLTGKNIYLSGYWQSEKYFKDIEDMIKQEVTLKNPLGNYATELGKLIDGHNSVSLHIRRGDYLNEKFSRVYTSLPLAYYTEASKVIMTKVAKPHFFIFSDDLPWVEKNFSLPYQAVLVGRNQPIADYEQLILMSRCRHNIMANSSFSWWGAWLNNRPDKLVIAPKDWFASKKYHNRAIYPDYWIKI